MPSNDNSPSVFVWCESAEAIGVAYQHKQRDLFFQQHAYRVTSFYRYRRNLILLILFPAFFFGCKPRQLETPQIIENARHAVVIVKAFDRRDSLFALGSGFFVTKNEIITNKHVVEHAKRVEVESASHQIYLVTYVTGDVPEKDLIKLGVDVRNNLIVPIQISRDTPRVGEKVVVIGAPLGLEGTASEGIVSAIRALPRYNDILQITASISHGSSGSPVLNDEGRVVGVASSYLGGGQNLNFAIPVRTFSEMTPETLLSFSDWKRRMLKSLYKKSASEKIRLAAIKSRTVWEYSISEEGMIGTGKKKSFSAYDRDGNETEHIRYDDHGNIYDHTLERYDSQGRLVEKTYAILKEYDNQLRVIDDYKRGKIIDKTRPIREAIARLDEELPHIPSGVWAYIYDAKGNCIEELNVAGQETTRTYNKFDERGNKIETLLRDRNGKHVQRSVSRYDDKGMEIETETKREDRKISHSKTEYQYNATGDKLEAVTTDYDSGETKLSSYRLLFDDFERTIHMTDGDYKDERHAHDEAYAYDDESNLIQYVRRHTTVSPPSTFTWKETITYDDYGNPRELVWVLEELPFVRRTKALIQYEYYDN